MKRIIPMNLVRLASLVTLLTMLGGIAPMARSAEVNDNLYNYLQLLRSDTSSIKVELINSIMKLSAEDAKKFWPIYREYENELGKLAVNRAEMVAEFVQSYQDGSFDNVKAKDIAKRWFKSQRARLELLEKYHGKIEDALSSVQAGQFLQIENQLGLFIDMTIAAEMPKVGAKNN
jgi:DNA repair ATPase RecN